LKSEEFAKVGNEEVLEVPILVDSGEESFAQFQDFIREL